MASNVNNYNQIILQNTSSGSSASTNFNVSNNLGTSGTNYGEFGINSSNFVGTGALSTSGNVYLAAASTDLAIGTYGPNNIHFVVNSSGTDAMTITSGGNVGISGTLNLAGNTITGGTTTSGYVLTATSTNTASFQPATGGGGGNYLPISGGTISGNLTVTGTLTLSGSTVSTDGAGNLYNSDIQTMIIMGAY